MTVTADTKLEAWERGERRRTFYVAGLFAVLVVLVAVVSLLAVILVRRSPVIARIDASEKDSACVAVIEASFLSAVGELIDGRSDSPERRAELAERVRLTTAALTRLAEPDAVYDPCSIRIPPPADASP